MKSTGAGRDDSAFTLKLWTVEDRLPGLPLTGLAQSQDGYIWLSAHDKLIRFNGVDFASLPVPNEILTQTGDLQGVSCGVPDGLWFYGANGIGRFNCGEWDVWPVPDDSATLIGKILGLVISNDGVVRAYAERGLFEAVTAEDDATTRFQPRTSPVPSDDRATLGAVTAADADHTGRIWMTAWNGLVEYANGRFDDKSTRLPDFLVEAVAGVHVGKSGRLWINGPNGIAYLEKNIWTPIGFPENAGLVSSMVELNDGSLWIGNPTGIYRWFKGKWSHVGEDEISALMSVTKVIEDRDGTVWATSDGGLLNIRRKLVKRMRSDGMVTEGTAYSLCILPNGNVWAGFRGHAVRMDAESGRILQTIYLDVDLPVSAVLQDSQGLVWMGTLGGGLFKSTGADYPAIVAQKDYSLPIIHTIHALLEVPGLGVLAGTPQGVMRVTPTGELEKAVIGEEHYDLGVKNLYHDYVGTIWLCGDGSEIIGYRTDGEKRVLNESNGLKGYARCAYLDSKERLWVGTTAGLFYLKEDHLYAVGEKTAGFDQTVSQIAEDSYGRLWLGTRDGLLVLSSNSIDALNAANESDYTTGVCMRKLSVADGVPGTRALGGVSVSAMVKKTDDFPSTLLFPFEGGICVVDPARFEISEKPPQVVFERVFADGKLLVDNLHGGCSEVVFNPGARNLVFHFGILAPAEQASFFYRHRLNGMQTGWSPVQRERSASFEWLPPGKYSFEVVTGNGDLWSEESAELNFEVRAFFWQTTWFYVCLAAVLAAFIFLIARSIVNQRYKMQMEMMRREEALHHERARISRDIHDDLGNGLSVVATLSELTHSDVEKESAHRRLDQIYDVANELARNVDEIVWAVNPVNDSWEPFISYFEQYTEYFLGNTALRFHFARPPELSDVKVASKTRHHLLLSVREAIGNILKHADAGQVNITMSIEKDELIIRVEDDGKGFDATVSAGVGHNGLVNMSRRMKEINGNMVIDSVPGRGTTITFSVRLERLNGFGGDIDA